MIAHQANPATGRTDGRLAVSVRNIRVSFGSVKALKGVSIDVHQGEVICIIGPSGSGKSTLLRCLNGLQPTTGGDIEIVGHRLPCPDRAQNNLRADVGMVFQHFNLFPHMTVEQNVTFALRKVRRLSQAEAVAIAKEKIEQVGLSSKLRARPSWLSGGQQQRVAIARALAMDPKVMLFDEATSALDPELVKGILAIIEDLAKGGMTMAIVTHEMNFGRRVADKIVFMDAGQIIEAGSPQEIFETPKTDRLKRFLNEVL